MNLIKARCLREVDWLPDWQALPSQRRLFTQGQQRQPAKLAIKHSWLKNIEITVAGIMKKISQEEVNSYKDVPFNNEECLCTFFIK